MPERIDYQPLCRKHVEMVDTFNRGVITNDWLQFTPSLGEVNKYQEKITMNGKLFLRKMHSTITKFIRQHVLKH